MWLMEVYVYILLRVERGEPWKIAAEVSKVSGVKTSHVVTGSYDIIAFAELGSLDSLKDIIMKIHGIAGVQHTETAVCLP